MEGDDNGGGTWHTPNNTLHFAACFSKPIFKILAKDAPDWALVTRGGLAPIHCALCLGKTEVLNYIIGRAGKEGRLAEILNPPSQHRLFHFCPNPDVVRLLLAQPEFELEENTDALYWAAQRQWLPVCEMLIDRGVINLKNNRGNILHFVADRVTRTRPSNFCWASSRCWNARYPVLYNRCVAKRLLDFCRIS